MNQIPNIEEIVNEYLDNYDGDYCGDCYDCNKKKKGLIATLHHQLQKAREEERERIKKDLDRRLEIQKKVSSSEYEGGYTHALQDVKEAYQSELDQPTV